MTAALFLDSPWLDAVAPDLAVTRPYRALQPTFLTVLALGDDLTDMILDLQAVAWRSAETFAAADRKTLKGVAFGAEELTMTLAEADQPIVLCALMMRTSTKGEISRTDTIALFPFVDFDVFAQAIDLADARRRMQTASQAARRIRL